MGGMQDLPADDILPPPSGLQDTPDRAPASLPASTPVPPLVPHPATTSPDGTLDGAPAIERRSRRAGLNRAFRAVKAQHASKRTLVENVADRLTGVASSTPFLLLHLVWFGVWIIWNSGLTPLRPFDPYPFGFLTMVVSLEAIFLSIFVLMSQNREAAIAELREEVMLQVNLRMEEELTKTLQLLAGLYGRLGYKVGEDAELLEMLQPLDAHALEKELQEQIREIDGKARDEKGRE